MSNDVAIRVENLSKLYKIGARQEAQKTLRESVMGALTAPWRRLKRISQSAIGRQPSTINNQPPDTIWALKDVSFDVSCGEVLGIIGPNGAGKTTLLKILSRITEPTMGRAEIYGRVGSLLEVGTGFHPELTGRENIYLNGAILGMTKAEIQGKFDEIVAFAEIEKFIDTPVKRYSSGMYVRLAFAVAAHLEPEILLVDEVLAVGDAAFQKKCQRKMGSVAMEGRTVLFVSHNMEAVQKLCSRAILIEEARIRNSGETEDIIIDYFQRSTDITPIDLGNRKDRKGSGRMRFLNVALLDEHGEEVTSLICGKRGIIRIQYSSDDGEPLEDVIVAIPIEDHMGNRVTDFTNAMTGTHFELIDPEGYIFCEIPKIPLLAGQYPFNLYSNVGGTTADWVVNAGVLRIEEGVFFEAGLPFMKSKGKFVIEHKWYVRP